MNKPAVLLTTGTAAALMAAVVIAEEQPAQAAKGAAPGVVVATNIIRQISGPDAGFFQPLNVDPALVRASMQARSEYDALTRKIVARQQKMYEENPVIRKLQANMRELQEQIDEILAADEELIRLNNKFKSISPQMPTGEKPSLPVSSSPPPAKE